MAHSIGPGLSVSGELQQQQHESSPRRRRLYELILAGFDHVLSQQEGHAGIDGREAGYVVWVPRNERYQNQSHHQQHQQQKQETWDDDADQEEEDDGCKPLVLYGGGCSGLFNVREQPIQAWRRIDGNNGLHVNTCTCTARSIHSCVVQRFCRTRDVMSLAVQYEPFGLRV